MPFRLLTSSGLKSIRSRNACQTGLFMGNQQLYIKMRPFRIAVLSNTGS